jgi:hypothetical protein
VTTCWLSCCRHWKSVCRETGRSDATHRCTKLWTSCDLVSTGHPLRICLLLLCHWVVCILHGISGLEEKFWLEQGRVAQICNCSHITYVPHLTVM